jgi:hypothetical protein
LTGDALEPISAEQRLVEALKVTYVEERLAEIRASMGGDFSPPSLPRAKSKSQRHRHKRSVEAEAPTLLPVPAEPAGPLLDRFEALAGQLRVEDDELTET